MRWLKTVELNQFRHKNVELFTPWQFSNFHIFSYFHNFSCVSSFPSSLLGFTSVSLSRKRRTTYMILTTPLHKDLNFCKQSVRIRGHVDEALQNLTPLANEEIGPNSVKRIVRTFIKITRSEMIRTAEITLHSSEKRLHLSI